jgi:2-keto-4-pentenoate hydratase/2-oxohepta-3-ene-1,7-dioic acid hydratase in catechol pathway
MNNRREFLKLTGAAALAATGGLTVAAAEAKPAANRQRGMARSLTLLTVQRNGAYCLGVKTVRGILDVQQAARILKMPAPPTIDDLLQNEDGPNLNALVAAALQSSAAASAFLKEESVQYGPVVTRPDKIVCVGINYRKHALEVHMPIQKRPVLFNKPNCALNYHQGTIKLPVEVATKFDYEVELVVVMGKEARNVGEAEALSYVAGYCTGNDFSARDLQLEVCLMLGKALNEFAPLGPYLVTADQIDPDNLKIECRVNGETRQSSNTSDMIFSSRQLISYISRYVTLKPGDIIFTGTPEGVILGKPKDRQVWLKPGDKLACSLEKLGELKFELV